MALHRRTHPTPVPGCFGCRVIGVGYDGKHLTRARTDEFNNTTTEHRSGRVDIHIRAPKLTLKTHTREER